MIKITLILITLVMIGCAQKPQLPPEENWSLHQKQLEQLTHYQVSGSFSYLSPKTKHYARFFWNQRGPTEYVLLITTPLGSKVVDVISMPDHARIIDNKGTEYLDDNVEILLDKLMGMSLPLAKLQQLLIGLATEDEQTQLKLNKDGYLDQVTMQYDNKSWLINFKSYKKQQKRRLTLPERIELSQGEIKVTLRLTDWKY